MNIIDILLFLFLCQFSLDILSKNEKHLSMGIMSVKLSFNDIKERKYL